MQSGRKYNSGLSLIILQIFEDWNNQVVFRHEVVLDHKSCEATAQSGATFEVVENLSVVIVGVRKDAIDATTNGAQLCY